MKNHPVALLLLILSWVPAGALIAVAEQPMISCEARGCGWSSLLTVSESGQGVLSVRKGGGPVSRCPMKVRGFDRAPGAEIPNVTLEFDREACSPALDPKLDREILPSLTLQIERQVHPGRVTYQGVLHWLRFSQAHDCAIKRFDSPAAGSAFERWKLGTWPQ